jgi:signal peptidase I
MSKSKKPPKSRESIPKMPGQMAETAAQPQAPWFRETVESIVIAFVLAFLFRTFEAEAFVIPTGSMAPTLMGRHKDVDCTQCGHRFQVTASEEESEQAMDARAQGGAQAAAGYQCVGGVCPMCRYTMPMAANLPNSVLASYPAPQVANHRSYNGDRILVNKYVYAFNDPERWDIVVFHYPGDAQMNYIKRLVGLPGETLRIYQGDLFVKNGSGGSDGDFQIERKAADKVLAMRQLVHDTDFDPAALYTAGWPLRWSGPESGQGAWKLDSQVDGQTVRQRFSIDGAADDLAWIRYHNRVPDYQAWRQLLLAQRRAPEQGGGVIFPPSERDRWRPQLVMDFNAYNTAVKRKQMLDTGSLVTDPTKLGVHWVGDLMIEADIEVQEARGELVLDLVEGGQHFTSTINLENGVAKLSAGEIDGYAPTAQTVVTGPGSYRIGFANVDDQLFLFVKKHSAWFSELTSADLVVFEGGTEYEADTVFGNRNQILPKTSELDPGDLAPAGVGARGAILNVTRLQMWRDIYYIADSSNHNLTRFSNLISDFDPQVLERAFMETLPFEVVKRLRLGQRPTDESLAALPIEIADSLLNGGHPTAALLKVLPGSPKLWDLFAGRRHEDFQLGKDQFFVMGDNSPESSDARLWRGEHAPSGGRPGGEYLERRLLIGKALCVYWPHSWNRIPGTPIPFPLFPNFEDMRLVR